MAWVEEVQGLSALGQRIARTREKNYRLLRLAREKYSKLPLSSENY